MPDTVDKTDSDWRFVTEKAGIMKLRSLFVAVAGAFLLTAAFVPQADAVVVVSYFNFEDTPTGVPLIDRTADIVGAAPPRGNSGGGIELTTSDLTITPASGVGAGTTPGLTNNRTPNDADTMVPGSAMFFSSSAKGSSTISFNVNLQFYAGLSLSFASNNNGNGYDTVTISNSFNTTTVASSIMNGLTTVTLSLPSSLNGDGMTAKFVTFTLTFSGGHSNGNDLQTVIDNIRLDATTIVPEPTTIAGGFLGVLGLCWFQRRRLIRSVRWRRA